MEPDPVLWPTSEPIASTSTAPVHEKDQNKTTLEATRSEPIASTSTAPVHEKDQNKTIEATWSEPIASTSTAPVHEKDQNKTTLEATCSTASTGECAICLETPDEVTASGKMLMSTKCGHIFCNSCIDRIFKESKSKYCPKCRKRINRRQIHPIFL
ncbi:hypothetical protein TNCV_3096371 [Trichonephila clavipes]|nr:hypothetical protein TNCV_3096371 [Trichonephila clavipes]